jgi:hypothetical protein
VTDDVALADIFTQHIISRLQSLENKTEAQVMRLCVLTCGDGTGFGMSGPDLVAFRGAWARYLACAFRIGLFEGAHGSDLRARLTGTDDDNFISAMNECLATWFLVDHLGLSATPRPSGKSGSVLELAVVLPEGEIFVEVKGLIRPITPGQTDDNLDILVGALDAANRQFAKGHRNLLVIVPRMLLFLFPSLTEVVSELLVSVFIGTRAVINGSDGAAARETFRPTGAFLKARPGNRVWFTRTSAVLVLNEHVRAPEMIYTARLLHNPKAKVALPTDIWGDVPQFKDATS